MAQNTEQINRVLGAVGLPKLSDPGLLPALGCLVLDHEHFRQLLTKCEPEHRTAMYEALRPHLRFRPKPLDVYIAESADLAERKQLPIQGPDGRLREFRPPEIAAVRKTVEASPAEEVLNLTCQKCTKEATFAGRTRYDAIRLAREAGWVYYERGDGTRGVICPDCPV